MDINITFGMNMDGASWSPKAADLGRICYGPAGMLSLLESRLGLDGVKPAFPERIHDYQKKIAQDTPAWCMNSFKLDAWDTAKQLLIWRDELMMAGWNGRPGSSSERLKALADIEANSLPIGPGEAERLHEVLRALPSSTWSGTLELLTAKKHLPFLWRCIVECLESAGMNILDASSANDLTAQCLCVTAPEEMTLAKHFARYLAASKDNHDVAVIAEGDTRLLDGVLRQYGFNAVGHALPSRWRASLQILPLWLDLLWKPFKVHHFMELLALPVSPFPPSVSRMLADVLKETPGIGSEKWIQGWENLLRHVQEKDGHQADAEKYLKWRDFIEQQCFQAEKDVPGKTVMDWCDKLLSHLAPKTSENPRLYLAMSHATILKKLLDDATQYDQITLARMLDTIIGDGLPGDASPEVTPFAVYTHPGAIQRPYKTILWWNFVAPREGSTYWTPDEKCAVPNLASQDMERETAAWKRAVGFAQQTVIAFTPSRLAGEPVFLHPLADEITFNILPAESLVDEQGRWQLAERTLRLQPQEIQSPTPPESFTIRPNEIAPRRKFSYSQMSKLLACPFRWFMDDYLGLKKPSGLDLPTGSLLIGILAHKIVELLYKNSERLAPEDASTRAGELFEELVPKMAAELLEEGNALGKERIKHTLQRAIKELVQRINEQGLSVKATEKELNGDFPPCGFTGKADCYLEDAAGNAFVIDMKWSFSSKYNEMLQSHKALQLATYAWLLRPDDFNAQCAYFLFPKSELLYENGEDWQRIWNTAKELWSAKRDAMQGGQLALGDPKDKEQLVTPECTYCDYQTICKREK